MVPGDQHRLRPQIICTSHITSTALINTARLASIGELAADVAHEIRNPLMVIHGTLEIIDVDGEPDAVLDDLEAIRDSAKRATHIIDGLLQFARQTLDAKEDADLNDHVQSMMALRKHLLIRHGIEVEVHFSDDLMIARGDRTQLGQVIVNLVSNAEHATLQRPPGDRSITIRTEARRKGVLLLVEDSGPGIPPAMMERIVDPVFTKEPVGEGAGLGLSISYGIIEAHGGRIEVKSPPQSGCIVTLSLPRCAESAPPKPVGWEGPSPPTEQYGKIMVVDDEAEVRRVVRRFLTKRGFEVREAANGYDALRMADAEDFDAIILDWRMPGLDGRGVLEHLERKDPRLARRVILASGEASVMAPGRPSLVKPYNLGTFEALVHQVLSV